MNTSLAQGSSSTSVTRRRSPRKTKRFNADALTESVNLAERRVRMLLDVAVARLQLVTAARPFPKLQSK